MTFRRKLRLIALQAAAIVLLIFSIFLSAHAATFTVTKTADTFDGTCDADCSLREAILAANAVSTDDVVEFSPAVFNTAKTIATIFGEFTIANNGSLTINGTGINLLTLDGSNARRVFDINTGATAFINAVKITKGNGRGEINTLIAGGAIFNKGGNLTVTNSLITGNGALEGGGGLGGGIYNKGIVTLNSTTVSDNIYLVNGESGGWKGGGIYNATGSTLNLNNSSVSNNNSINESGGGIYDEADVTINIVNSVISGNTCTDAGGGGLYHTSGTMNISGSTFSNNTIGIRANGGGGGIRASGGNLTITGTTFSNNSGLGGGGGILATGVTGTIANSIFNANTAPNGAGGGLLSGGNLSVTNSTFTNNISAATTNFSGATGGGIFNGGTLTVTDSIINNNTAVTGGGITNNFGTITITNSEINNNTADAGGGICSGCTASFSSGGVVNITNSTISGNTATGAAGGGINNSQANTVNLTNVTINANKASSFGGVLGASNGSVTNARNTIIGNNFNNNGTPSDFQGTLTSQGYNLIENTTGTTISGTTTGNILGQDPQLVALRNNGGVTQTVALQPGSPAIDAGDPNNFPATDQRGVARAQDGDLNGTVLPDIGAYERKVTPFTVTKTADTNDGACDADCSLREAFAASNAETNPDIGVLFDSSFGAAQTIVLNGSEIVIGNNKTFALYGTGSELLTISGGNQSRVFYNASSSLLLSKVHLTYGNGIGASDSGFGGAVYNGTGFLAIVDSLVDYNSAQSSGGAIFSGQNNTAAVLRVTNSLFRFNWTINNDGGAIALSGKSGFIANTLFGENRANRNGGAIYSFGTAVSRTISGSRIIDNTAISSGGGLYLETGGSTAINDTTINLNTSDNGGGIYNSGSLSVLRSTINANTSQLLGGAVLNDLSGIVATVNTTVSGNTANGNGGGIYNVANGSVTLNYSTVAFNKTNGIGGGIFNTSAGTINARSTIIARNEAVAQSPDIEKNLTSQGFNLIGNTSGATISGTTTGNLLNTDPRLDPILRNNGGATMTHALRLGSPALDKGAAISGVTTDQRGSIRPFDFPSVPNASGGNGSDIGAFERQTNDPIRNFVPFDFDGDGKTDVSIFRPSNGEWWYSRSSDTQVRAAQFGSLTDKPVPADFTGDGKTDIAFYRPSTGEWFILRSEDASFLSFPFGNSNDIPAVGDFDSDGKADPAVFRPSTGEWFILKSSGGTIITTFGTSGDVPVAADYDGDGKTDIAIFRPADGSWWHIRSSDNQFRVYSFGVGTDKPVQGDWTGDGKADIAVYRPSTGVWYFQRSEDNSFYSLPFGLTGDIPAPGDYDGDGKFDTAVFRPSNATWYVQRSNAGLMIQQFGLSGDIPTPSVFIP